MSKFKTPLNTEIVDDTHDRLLSPLIFGSSAVGDVEVPAGYETDYASVPRIPLAYLLFGGKAKKPSVIHDFLYTSKKFSREVSDGVFLEAMEDIDLAKWRRRLMYRAVRAFGWTAWNKETSS